MVVLVVVLVSFSLFFPSYYNFRDFRLFGWGEECGLMFDGRYAGCTYRQEDWDRTFWKCKDAEFHGEYGEGEDVLHTEVGVNC